MKKITILSTTLCMSLGFLTSCKEGAVQNLVPCEFEPQDETTRECVVPAPITGTELDYKFVELENFNEEQDTKVREVLKRVKLVINSLEFKEKILNHEFQGEKTFVDNNGLTNEQVYETIMKGEEDLVPGVDHTMNLTLSMYYKYGSTVGYTYPDTMKIWINSRFFNGYTFGQAGGNIVHEWTHKLGFGHSYYNDYARPYSVPYAIGTIIEDLVDKM